MKILALIIPFMALSMTAVSQWKSNLGIGVDTPQYKLDVDGNINITDGHGFLIDGKPISTGKSLCCTNGNDAYYNLGRIGIGTNTPNIKLHIKDSTSQLYFGYQSAYDGPYINMVGEIAGQTPMFGLGLAQKDYNYNGNILCYKDWAYLYGNNYNKGIAIIPDLVRAPDGLYVDKYGSVGVGVETPVAKFQVADGDIYISDIQKGIIMKSPDGNCWRGVLDNSGQLKFTSIDCPNESIANNLTQLKSQESVLIYPNPTQNKIEINFGEIHFENANYEINNINGQLIENGMIKSNNQIIDISELTNGIYLFSIYDKKGEKLKTEKIIKE